MFLIQFSSFWLFSGGKHGFVYPEVTWHEYSNGIGSENFASQPDDRDIPRKVALYFSGVLNFYFVD